MLTFKWRTVIDLELNIAFGISPWTGLLIVQAVPDGILWQPPRLLGFHPNLRGAPDDFVRTNEIVDPTPNDDGLPQEMRSIALRRARVFYRLSFTMPIVCLMAVADIDSRRQSVRRNWLHIPEIERAVAVAALLFGTRPRGDCLPLSIIRYWFLRSVGQDVRLHVGTFVPTDTMHAWVQIGERPILESADDLVHYQSCLVYAGQ